MAQLKLDRGRLRDVVLRRRRLGGLEKGFGGFGEGFGDDDDRERCNLACIKALGI